jgi:NAD+ kinase
MPRSAGPARLAVRTPVSTPVRSVGAFLKADQPEAAGTVRALVAWLRERRVEVRGDAECERWTDLKATPRDELAAWADLLVGLGGDGTLLAVARAAGTRRVPILGINLGTFGYLTEVNVDEMFAVLERVLAGEEVVESRMRLEVVAERGGVEVGCYQALNDAVITKTALSRMIDLETRADGASVTTYHADGLIVSTPTGSTAYSLSAGGPILLPGSDVMVLTPICSHSLTQRPLVLPQSCILEITVRTRGDEAFLTVDGQEGLALRAGDRVAVRRSEHPIDIVASPYRTRFDILRAKLRWGER